MFSATCGTANIEANRNDAIRGIDDEILDLSAMEVESVSSDLAIGSSRPNSRPGSSLSFADSQDVSKCWKLNLNSNRFA